MISIYLPPEHKIGSGYQAHYMANALVRRGHRVTMHSPAARGDDALYEVMRIDVGSRNRTYRFARELQKINWQQFDILHAHGEDQFLWTRLRPPHIRTMHGSCLAEALHVPGLKEKLRMTMIGLSEVMATMAADATVCISQNTRPYFPWLKRVILNGVDTSMFTPAIPSLSHTASPSLPISQASDLKSDISNLKEPTPTLLFVGTYQNRKRGKLLMEIFARDILPKIPAAKMWMVCSDAPAAPNVEVLGRLSTPELADRFRRAWVFCLPSTYEGFGVPYIEAMASGTPVVASPNVGAKEVLANGKFGIVATDADLGPAIAKLFSDESERAKYRELGLQRAKEFDWNHIVAQYEKVYEELLVKGSHAPVTQKANVGS
jgi:glycosyltransferase involved in cell wall biosynthesis